MSEIAVFDIWLSEEGLCIQPLNGLANSRLSKMCTHLRNCKGIKIHPMFLWKVDEEVLDHYVIPLPTVRVLPDDAITGRTSTVPAEIMQAYIEQELENSEDTHLI